MPTPEVEVDYYALLGIDPGADAVTIRKALVGEQRLWGVRQNAPDLAARHAAELRMLTLVEARDVLLDPSRRALYDVQRVPFWLTGPESPEPPVEPAKPTATRGRSTHKFWPTAVGGVAIVGFVMVPLLRGERAPAASPPQLAASPVTRNAVPTAPTTTPVPATEPVRMDAPVAPESTVVPTVLASIDGLPMTLSGSAQSASGVPVESEPVSLAAGRYVASWSITGQPPCGIVIRLAEPGATGHVPAVLVNHVLKRGEGQLAQGQTSIVLNSGKYRLDVAADLCAWSVTFTAAPPG
jgi:hypothetical protein